MIKKIIVALVVVLAVCGLVFATIGNSNNKNNTNSSTSQVQNQIQSNDNITNNNTQTKISSTEAQKIASKYIEVSTATAGTPNLVNQDNNLVYIVPVIDNGTTVGEITIDAITGENLGGAGGSP
jgi:uncharacterized membrane protein YkoI